MRPYLATRRFFAQHGLEIRESYDSDLDGISAVKSACFAELAPRLVRWYAKHPEAYAAEFFGPDGQDPLKRMFYTVLDGPDDIVGCGGLVQKSPKKEQDIGEISSLYLLPDHRGDGLGRRIMDDLINKARVMKFRGLFLTTRVEFEAAIKLYGLLGFRPARKQKYKSDNSISLEMLF